MIKRNIVIGVMLVLVLVVGSVSALAQPGVINFRRLTPDEYEAIGGHLVTPEEYEAIQNGEINLDDGIPRFWVNPDAVEEAGIATY